MPNGFFRKLIADGVIAGVGGVIVFLPNILILFMGVSFMEDTGYMARAAFIMDKIMHRLGIHGKSFIPLVMGFGCTVPAIMATRTLENRRDRIITVLINPFMSCSARLPVYVLFAGVFFAHHAGSVILSLYLVGMLMAFLSSKIFSRVLSQERSAPFVMELPPYRMPTARAILFHMWNRSSQYLRKMGGIILVFSVLVWFLSSFPQHSPSGPIAPQHGALANISQRDVMQTSTNREVASHSTIAHTYMGRLGKMVEPALSPLGFTWQMSVALLTGIVAKEVVISTLNIFYTEEHQRDARPASLEDALNRDPDVSPLSAYVYMLFVLLYIPCIATTVAIGREIGWRWAFFSIGYNLTLTWAVCFAVYRIGMVVVSL
jgi:ferrous iron transport protein B